MVAITEAPAVRPQAVRVIFVDDDQDVLQGIENALFADAPADWETEFVSDGRAALAMFEEEPFDVLVTDMIMPGMGGAELLGKVAHDYPESVRIVLTSETNIHAAMRAMPLAHQFLAKPTGAHELVDAIQRGWSLRARLSDSKVRAVVGEIEFLPARPHTYTRIMSILAEEDGSAADVAEVIERDPAIASKVLHIANSAFFSRGIEIPTVRAAVARIGTQVVGDLVLGMEASRGFNGVAQGEIDAVMEDAVKLAAVAQTLAPDSFAREQVFTAGLLHDIGRLVLAWKHPDAYRGVTEVSGRGADLVSAERTTFGADHAEVGGYLLALWGLPLHIVDCVVHHHDLSPMAPDTSWILAGAARVLFGAEDTPVPAADEILLAGLRDRNIELDRAREFLGKLPERT